jgi:hypothetical protein
MTNNPTRNITILVVGLLLVVCLVLALVASMGAL